MIYSSLHPYSVLVWFNVTLHILWFINGCFWFDTVGVSQSLTIFQHPNFQDASSLPRGPFNQILPRTESFVYRISKDASMYPSSYKTPTVLFKQPISCPPIWKYVQINEAKAKVLSGRQAGPSCPLISLAPSADRGRSHDGWMSIFRLFSSLLLPAVRSDATLRSHRHLQFTVPPTLVSGHQGEYVWPQHPYQLDDPRCGFVYD